MKWPLMDYVIGLFFSLVAIGLLVLRALVVWVEVVADVTCDMLSDLAEHLENTNDARRNSY